MHQANVFHDSLSLMFSVQVSSSGATKHSKGFLSRAGRQQQDPTLLKGRISKVTEKSVRSLANPLRRPKALCKIHPPWYREKTLVLDSSLRSIPHLALGTQHFCAWSLLFNFVIQLVQPGEYSWGAHTLQSSLDGGNRKSCSPWRGDALGSSKHSFKNCLVQESLAKWYDPGSSCSCWDIAARHKLAPARVLQCAVQEGCELVWGERSSTRKCEHFQEIPRDTCCVWSECQGWKNSNPSDRAEVKRLFPLCQWGLSQPCWNSKYLCMICMPLWCLNCDHILLSLSTRKIPSKTAKQK